MPYPNEHSCRLENPDKYDRFARRNCAEKHDGKCIDFIFGIKEGKSELQAMRYDKKIWTEGAAQNHCKEHNGTFEAAQETKEATMENELRGVLPAGIAVLNGARGGADIPTSDKQGVWNHVASHLKDADVEPALLKSAFGDKIEWRTWERQTLELRAEEGKPALITGLAAPFGKLSEPIMGSFLEKIDPKAFDETLDRDIRCLFNHEPNYVLGRTISGDLRLQIDKSGLRFEVDPPDTQWARDLQVSIRRGNINQMSFAFECLEDAWDKSGEMPIRTLKRVKLQDISIVTYPAYPQTKVGMRALTEDELITVLDRYFQPKAEPTLQAPQVLTEGHGNLARLKRRLKVTFLWR